MILDTNALSAYLERTAEAVEIVSDSSEIAIPVIVAGEFSFGIAPWRHREAFERSLQRMLDRCTVLDIEIETARHYAAIRLELRAGERCLVGRARQPFRLCGRVETADMVAVKSARNTRCLGRTASMYLPISLR